ncbi:MAG TPA: DUF3035 domain-containing protein [Parvularcula sp.]|nr:DUF3035 domain-containing protein [Parvularcula sp.]HBS32470.1 DUF3035 domain-containing protein [Parvularcula sp.]HBS36468.1 DUF3035 domain-containing protein [Parvularcula sp.]
MTKVTLFRVALALGAVVAAGGCAGLGKALGSGKNPPDEFAIATKAPLVVPPDYSLRPPKPGETRPQELAPSERARQVLLGDTSAAAPSPGEKMILQKAGALGADQNIRAVLAAENGGRAEKDRSLANQLMFWKFIDGKVDDSAAPLRVDDPAAWHAERKEAIDAVTGEGAKVTIKADEALLLPGIF